MRAHGGDVAGVLDFSVNTNPYGPCAAVRDAIAAASVERYPDPAARAAREALGDADRIALGNGAADLLWTLARVLAGPTLIVEPTFSELRAAAVAAGSRVVEWRARPPGFAIDLAAIGAAVREHDATLVYLCVPNNPTGAIVPVAAIAEWAASLAGARVVLDQSFLSLSTRAVDAEVPVPPNVVRVRSLTKDHGIPGVRVGYLIADPAIVARVEAARPAWTTGAHAQAAAIAAARSPDFVTASARRLLDDRARMDAALVGLGLAPVPSSTVFSLVPVGDAAALRARLLARHGILVRAGTSFGLPAHVRLAARPAPDRARLVAALAEELR